MPTGRQRQAAADLADHQQPFDRQQASQKIEQVTSALKIVLTVMTALLILASLMLVGNTIRLSIYTRRREVEVMRLVGATRWFIRWPFMIEGVVVGFVGGLVAILILWLGKITVVDPLSDSFSFLAAQNNSTLSFPALVAILFAAAVIVSTIGSGVTLRRTGCQIGDPAPVRCHVERPQLVLLRRALVVTGLRDRGRRRWRRRDGRRGRGRRGFRRGRERRKRRRRRSWPRSA